MKAAIYDINGNKKKEIELPSVFETKIREDIVHKIYEAEKFSKMHQYTNYKEAGKRHSASGTISHKRHDWKGHYGHGMSRIPRKVMWRRGTQFFWIGAEVSSTRGGRRAHPPKFNIERKINKKEKLIAINSAIAATANSNYISRRYSSLEKLNIHPPLIIESHDKLKTKDFIKLLEKLLGEKSILAFKKKTIRAGKGKLRGRRYKSNAGLLLVTSKNEKIKMSGIDIRNTANIGVRDLYPLGRLTFFTEKSLNELSKENKK